MVDLHLDKCFDSITVATAFLVCPLTGHSSESWKGWVLNKDGQKQIQQINYPYF